MRSSPLTSLSREETSDSARARRVRIARTPTDEESAGGGESHGSPVGLEQGGCRLPSRASPVASRASPLAATPLTV